jgi:hypothetical protein
MKTDPQPYVTDAERVGGDVIITFQDGKAAVYSASLLHSFFPHAQRLPIKTPPPSDVRHSVVFAA